MGASGTVIEFPPGKSGKILKWKVKEGAFVSVGRVLLLYDINISNGREEQKKLKATRVGMVRKLLAKEGEIIQPGEAILELEDCTHPTVMNAMCAECGADLRKENQMQLNASVPMVHSIPELKVSQEQAEILGKADEERLLRHKKLVLLVDLDQTLIHTTNDNIPPNLKDVYHFQLYGPSSPWYHTRIRPGTQKFLSEMSQFYELHICTFGARNYAHMIAMFLDQDGQYFSHRILSRDECFNSNSKTANLKALFPCGDNMVCIIDDREDVWNFAPNLIHVKPYHFFQHTGDINAPPGLAKCENDDKEGFDFTKIGNEEQKCSSKIGFQSKNSKLQQKKLENEKLFSQRKQKKDPSETTTVQNEQEENKEHSEGKKHVQDQAVSDLEMTDDTSERLLENVTRGNVREVCDTTSKESKQNTVMNRLETDTEERTIQEDVMNKSGKTESEKKEVVQSNSLKDHSEGEFQNSVKESEKKDNDITSFSATQYSEADIKVKDENGEEDLVEVEDADDYLLHLEEILKTIHHAYYEIYDEEQGDVPDLKSVIPYVRRKVLAGIHLVFSGLVPTNVELEKSRVYQVAVSLGANVTQNITPQTTHLVAVRLGTAKVNKAQKMKNIFIVTPEWLWCCAERWEHVSEKLYPVPQAGTTNTTATAVHQQPAIRRRTPSGRFMDTINPLMSFSSEDIAKMDREVEDIFNESESESEDNKAEKEAQLKYVQKSCLQEEEEESSSSSADSLSGEHPHGWRKAGRGHRKRTVTESDIDEFEEDMPSAKFRRGEALPSDLDLGEDESASNGSEEPIDEIDDGDWNMMGAALEREFLSGNGD